MMKKLILFLLILLLLCSCAAEQPQPGLDNGIIVDTAKQTIYDGQYTYQYKVVGNEITITYPNGSFFTKEFGSGFVVGGGEVDSYEFVSPQYDLFEAVERIYNPEEPKEEPEEDTGHRAGVIFGGLFLAAFGLFLILLPEVACYIRTSIWVRDAEPTEFAIKYTRICGVLCVLISVIFVIANW